MKLSELKENLYRNSVGKDTKELTSRVRELELILGLLKKINGSLVLEDVLYSVLINAIKLANAERGFIVLKNKEGGLDFELGLDAKGNILPEHFFNISTTVVEDVFLTGQSRFIEGAQGDNDNHPSKSILRLALQTILCSPLIVENKKVGVIYVDSKVLSKININEITNMFEILASQAAVAIHNAAMYEELKKAKKDAEASDRLKSAFLSQMSHEIRTPLNTMLNYNALLREEFKDKVSEEMSFIFSGMDNSGNRIIRTLDNVLNMSLLLSGKFEIVPKALNLEKIISKILIELRSLADSKNLKIEFINNIDYPILIGDEYTLTMLFQNLIDNAIKFTSEGFVKIEISKTKSSKIKVEVEDSGTGISEDYLDNLFTIFSQEEIGYTRKYEGTGLGLALVKEFSKLNNCKVDVVSTKNVGTKFTVTFDKTQA